MLPHVTEKVPRQGRSWELFNQISKSISLPWSHSTLINIFCFFSRHREMTIGTYVYTQDHLFCRLFSRVRDYLSQKSSFPSFFSNPSWIMCYSRVDAYNQGLPYSSYLVSLSLNRFMLGTGDDYFQTSHTICGIGVGVSFL